MKIGIHQPAYLPWLGYFEKIAKSDVFVFLDIVQFQKSSFQNRNLIMTKQGPVWLSVPIKTSKVLYRQKLYDTKIDNSKNWQKKHFQTIKESYSKSAGYDSLIEDLMSFYEREYINLADMCWDMLALFKSRLSIKTKILRASQLDGVEGAKGDLILSICKSLKADKYLSGSMGRHYLDLEKFSSNGIEVEFQNFKHPVYKQMFHNFTPNMAVIDYLFCLPSAGVLGLEEIR